MRNAGFDGCRVFLVVTLLAVLGSPGCIPFSSYQSARIVPSGETTFTGSASFATDPDAPDSESTNEFSIQSQTGTPNPGLDYGFKGSFTTWGSEFTSAGFSTNLRVGMVPDYLTLKTPVTYLVFEGGGTEFYFHPTTIASVPITPSLEINGSATAYVGLGGDETPYSYSIGLAVGPPGGFRLRPEVAWFRSTDADDGLRQFGIGLEFPVSHEGDEPEEEDDGSIFRGP